MDRHEYEINQLINPKKDIVKSNSKHRDKIETLIQGRCVEGIGEGGDTPPKTYIAVTVSGSSGPFAFGELGQNNEIIFQCKEENIPWVASEAGLIVAQASSFPGAFTYVWKPKIDAALGIDSTASTVISSLIQGDEVPNWNSYQKIV